MTGPYPAPGVLAADFVQPAERVRAIAFDLDGTLVDTAPDLADAVNAALTVLGCRALPEARIAALIGDGFDQLVARALAESFGRPPPAGAVGAAGKLARRRYAERLFHQSRVYPGVRETLRALHVSGMPLCCITNKHSGFALPLLRAAQLERFFAFTLCADDARERKPRPDLLLAACARLGVTPAQLLYVGDSDNDVAAARAAGCPIVVVAYGYGDAGAADRIVADFPGIAAFTRGDGVLPPREGHLRAR